MRTDEERLSYQRVYQREWRKRNPGYHTQYGKLHRAKFLEYRERYKQMSGFVPTKGNFWPYTSSDPWIKSLCWARQRCNNPNLPRWQYYGGRGIKCFLTSSEIKFLWDRDRAYELTKPSLDRIDNDGNYTLENCRFIEMSENVRRASIAKRKKSCKICGMERSPLTTMIFCELHYVQHRINKHANKTIVRRLRKEVVSAP